MKYSKYKKLQQGGSFITSQELDEILGTPKGWSARNPKEAQTRLNKYIQEGGIAGKTILPEVEVKGKFQPSVQSFGSGRTTGAVPVKTKEEAKGIKKAKDAEKAVYNTAFDILPGIGDVKALWEDYQRGELSPLTIASVLPVVGFAGDAAKAFKPVIKEYNSATEMFTDFLRQAEEQGVKINRESKLYKQIQDEIPSAREYYKNIDTSDDQIADALYLSTKTPEAQKGLKDSKVQDMVYHGSEEVFDEFIPNEGTKGLLTNDTRIKLRQKYNSDIPIYTASNKQDAEYYGKVKGYLLNTKNTKEVGNVPTQTAMSLKQQYPEIDTFLGTEPKVNYKIQASFNPTQLKSLFREHLGKWDWNNPNIHRVVGAGVGLGVGTKAINNKKESNLKGGSLLEKYKLKSRK